MNPKNLVHRLRKTGIKVGVKHYRYVLSAKDILEAKGPHLKTHLEHVTDTNKNDFRYIASLGGETHVRITFPDGKEYNEMAPCGKRDAYCKRLGISVGVGRILKRRRDEGIIDEISKD